MSRSRGLPWLSLLRGCAPLLCPLLAALPLPGAPTPKPRVVELRRTRELLVRLARDPSHEVELGVRGRCGEVSKAVGHREEGGDRADLPDLLLAETARTEPLE